MSGLAEAVAIRPRRTKAAMAQLTDQLVDVLAEDHPQSARHLFYRMTDPRLPEPVEKSDRGYDTVQRLLVNLRRSGVIPYGWITDSTRRGYFAETYRGPERALRRTATAYRRSYWDASADYVETWCESRSIAGIIQGTCEEYAVPLYPSGGFASLSLIHDAAENIAYEAANRPVHILYIGDHDPAGVLIDRKIEAELRDHLPDTHLSFHRLAVTRDQIELWGLPTKPAKDRRGGFDGGTVEAEAIPAATMRQLLADAIAAFIDPHEMAVLRQAEASERGLLMTMAASLEAGR
jgi:hypothetical protein